MIDALQLIAELQGYAAAASDHGTDAELPGLLRELCTALERAAEYRRIGLGDHAAAEIRHVRTLFRVHFSGRTIATGLGSYLRDVDRLFPD